MVFLSRLVLWGVPGNTGDNRGSLLSKFVPLSTMPSLEMGAWLGRPGDEARI